MVLLCYQMLQSVTKYILSNLQILLKKKKKNMAAQNKIVVCYCKANSAIPSKPR